MFVEISQQKSPIFSHDLDFGLAFSFQGDLHAGMAAIRELI
jgi:hypothetical protein